MAIEQFADILLEKLRFISQAETVVGKPIQAGEHTTIIPVSRVSLGFGLGGHSGKVISLDLAEVLPLNQSLFLSFLEKTFA